MKHVKILSIAAALFLSSTQCMAAVVNTPVVDPVNNTVTLSGEIEEGGKNIVITVLNPGVEAEDFLPDQNSSIDITGLQHQRVIASEPDGSFNYTFKLNIVGESNIGTYKVYIDSPKQTSALETDFFFASNEQRNNLVADLLKPKKQSEAELPEKAIARMLSEENTAKILALTSFEPFTKQNKDEIAEMLYSLIKDMTDAQKAEYTSVQLKQLISEYSLIIAYNNAKSELVISPAGEFLHEDIIKFDSVDTTLDMTLADIYKNTVSKEGQALIRNALMNKNYSSISDLQKEFAKEICLKGLTNAEKKGFAHVQKILTEKNAKAVGLVLSRALTDNEAVAIAQEKEYKSIEELQGKIDSLKNIDKNTGLGGNTGSSGNKGNGTGTISIGNLPAVMPEEINPSTENKPQEEKKFSDMTGYEWAEEAVYSLLEKGIINGVDDANYAPENLLTREQAVKLICVAKGITEEAGNGGFSDVDDAWYRGFVAAAKKAGIASGISQTEFGIGKNVTRQDFAVMICNAFGFSGEMETLGFADSEKISDYAKSAVEALCEKGIINGFEDNTFRPKDYCTRAQAAVIIYRVLENIGI